MTTTTKHNAQKEDNRAEAHLHSRVTVARKVRYVKQAQREGLSLTDWQQKHLDAVCDAADEIRKNEQAE